MKGDIRVSISDARGYPCPKDGTILTLLPGGAWCSECHTVWREKGEIPLSVAMYEIPSPERIAALEALWAWTEDMLDCADREDGYCNRHHEEFVGVCHRLAALADPPGSRDREDTT